jgi:4-hydroxy-3-methylbut-2-enyl diphosphate reductase
MKSFDIPVFYKSALISSIKEMRKRSDAKKKDFSPTLLDFGPIQIYLARHFGFCYGVENAIEISYKAIEENHGKRIFLLSQMIHNQEVNNDLLSRGIRFLMDTAGQQIIPWESLTAEDIVIIPAFGTTLLIEEKIKNLGITALRYNTTCPFVERVWSKSEKLGKEDYTIIIHGKHNHEETRATFSRAEQHGPSIIVKDIVEAEKLGAYISGTRDLSDFFETFKDRVSVDFNPETDLNKVGVINQTTMLASETQAISNYFKKVMEQKYGQALLKDHFADTRDTLCYATNENQEATYGLLTQQADLAIVVGGYNSSNTSHIVELCETKLPTYFISSEKEIVSEHLIKHFNYHSQEHLSTANFLPNKTPVKIMLTSGASCPDALVEQVLLKLVSYYKEAKPVDVILTGLA